jgi:hypothetical protein
MDEKSRNVGNQGKKIPEPKDILEQAQQSQKINEENKQK